MFVIYLGLIIVGAIIVIYFGLQLSKNIYHPTLSAFFWILYLASILTVSNIVATGLFYNVLRFKRGIPGDPGRIGEKGNLGENGICDTGCDSKVCTLSIMNDINKHYFELIQNALGKTAILNEKPVIINSEITNKINLICKSQAYKEIAKIKPPKTINDYVSNMYNDWITLLVNSDKSSDKSVIRNYLETDGMEEQPELPGNPFSEIEKYDAYYWGSDRIFHPRIIEYCSDPNEYKAMTQIPPPRMEALRTNMYSLIFTATNMGKKDVSIFRAGPYNYNGKTFYSLGDILMPNKDYKSGSKFIERYGVPEDQKDRTDFASSTLSQGPYFPTILLNSSDKYMMPPQDWIMLWRNRKDPKLTVWRPKDYYNNTLKKWFRACGVLFMTNWSDSNPRQQYGYNTPENQPIRLISEELLIDISKVGMKEVWNDRGSGVRQDLSSWSSTDPEYMEYQNTSVLVNAYRYPFSEKMYKLKREAFLQSGKMEPLDFNDDLVDEKKYGVGFHGSPHRSAKYSVFSWLQLPLEVQLSNIGNSYKIYVKHSGLNKINSYMIRKHFPNNSALTTFIGENGENKQVTEDNKFNPSKPSLIWEILCIDKKGNLDTTCSNEQYLIRNSKNTNLYFKVEVDKSTMGAPYYILKKLPNKDDPNYDKLIVEYIWYAPLSATGNQLTMEQKTNS